jgi:hypothetical protein
MPPLFQFLLAGAALVVAGVVAIRVSGAEPRLARRLAGARQLRVGDVLAATVMPARPIRIVGRIRCPRPIVTDRDERLVAFHRDVQVRPPGGRWRSIERIRESRGFELWDHDGSMPVDPALAAEPLVVIPHVWRGTTAELTQEGHLAAVARLGGSRESGWPARSVTRMVSVVERLLVLASVQRGADGSATLVPPPGGFVISGVDLDDAMRLLGGNRRWLLLAGYVLAVIGGLVGVGGVIGSVMR